MADFKMYETQYHTKDLSGLSFLITGGAGFIGANLVEYLLKFGAGKVRVLDNFSTGFRENLSEFHGNPAFELIEGDITDYETCKKAVEGIDYVSHQAALGSVPRSIKDPIATNHVNINGFLNIICAAKEQTSVRRLVYAASSSTYGDSKDLPKTEDKIGKPLSPYAVTKVVNELYADVFAKTYGLESIGLRYFNVFGPKQSPKGEYAAVIPLFINAAKTSNSVLIHGDGSQTRDFTFIDNVVQANIKAIFADNPDAVNQVYNIACGDQISLNELVGKINDVSGTITPIIYGPTRVGDIQNSWADISKAQALLSYTPNIKIAEGIKITYTSNLQSS